MSEITFIGPDDMEPWMLPDAAPDVVCERFKCQTCGMAGGPLKSAHAATMKMRCHCGTVYEVVEAQP